jgi:SAM-dependent MidA family methyltransferase
VSPNHLDDSQALRQIISDQIRQRGKISFAEFMEFCLYHPIHGYYQTEREKIGRGGDYYTSPSVHSVFGRLLAKQLGEMGDLLQDGPFWVLEAGAGRGLLAQDILDECARRFPAFYDRLRYGILERSHSFVDEQKRRLASYPDKVEWFDLKELQKANLQGCILANEFFDALPVHRIILQDGEAREIYVTEKGGSFCEVLSEPSSWKIHRYFADSGVDLVEGQQAEVGLEAIRWYSEAARTLAQGFFMIIDYGFLAHDLYASFRRSGTLLCYYRHTISDNPYGRVGLQDMTANVNFSALIEQGESLGFHVTGFVPQYQFLLSLGFLNEIEREPEKKDDPRDRSFMERLAMKRLILPDGGMGDTFKILIQHKGLEQVTLSGLQPL